MSSWPGFYEPPDDSSRLGVVPFGPLAAPEFFTVASDPAIIAYLYGPREEWFRYEVLDSKLNILGELDAALTGGELEFNIYNDIRGTGSLTLVNYDAFYVFEAPYPDPVDWMNHMVRITYCTPEFEEALITAIPQAPTESHSEANVQIELELFDKTVKLQEDCFGYTYTVAKGTSVQAAVLKVIKSIGEPEENLIMDVTSAKLTKDMTWPPDTSKLRIVNDLLESILYFAIYCDGMGRYRADKYVETKNRGISWTFNYGSLGLYLPEFKATTDAYAVPNKFVGVGVPPEVKPKEKPKPAPSKVAYDTDPKSPFSYASRGNRWITKTETDIEAANEADLQKIVDKRLKSAQMINANVEELRHPWLPFGMNDIVVFQNPRLEPIRATCRQQRINLYSGGLVTSTLNALV